MHDQDALSEESVRGDQYDYASVAWCLELQASSEPNIRTVLPTSPRRCDKGHKNGGRRKQSGPSSFRSRFAA